MQPEQLTPDTSTPTLRAHYYLVGDTSEPLTTQYLSPEVIQYLADSSLREVLEFQLLSSSKRHSAYIPMVSLDGKLRVTYRVPVKSLVETAANQ